MKKEFKSNPSAMYNIMVSLMAISFIVMVLGTFNISKNHSILYKISILVSDVVYLFTVGWYIEKKKYMDVLDSDDSIYVVLYYCFIIVLTIYEILVFCGVVEHSSRFMIIFVLVGFLNFAFLNKLFSLIKYQMLRINECIYRCESHMCAQKLPHSSAKIATR